MIGRCLATKTWPSMTDESTVEECDCRGGPSRPRTAGELRDLSPAARAALPRTAWKPRMCSPGSAATLPSAKPSYSSRMGQRNAASWARWATQPPSRARLDNGDRGVGVDRGSLAWHSVKGPAGDARLARRRAHAHETPTGPWVGIMSCFLLTFGATLLISQNTNQRSLAVLEDLEAMARRRAVRDRSLNGEPATQRRRTARGGARARGQPHPLLPVRRNSALPIAAGSRRWPLLRTC
jgi:hypothetical protein